MPDIDNDAYRVTWQHVFGPGLHFRYNLVPDEFFKTLIIESKASLPSPTIGLGGLRLTLVMAVAWHSEAAPANEFAEGIVIDDLSGDPDAADLPDEEMQDPEQFSFRDFAARDLWWLRKPRAWDSYESEEGPHSIAVQHRLRRKAKHIFALLSVPATALNHPATVYPVYMDTDIGEEQVGASTDDAYSASTTWPGVGNGNSGAAYYYTGESDVAFLGWGGRFTSVPIPQGATINTASIALCAGGNQTQDCDLTLYCEDEDDPATFAWNDTPPGRTRTTASAQWDIGVTAWTTGTWYTSTDIAAPVQEVVDRGGWAENNALSVFFFNTGQTLLGSWHSRLAYTYDQTGNVSGPKLNVSYTSGGTTHHGAGTIDGVATVAGAGSMLFAGAGAIAGVASLSGAASMRFGGAGSIAATSTVTGAATMSWGAAGSIAAVSTVTGAASVEYASPAHIIRVWSEEVYELDATVPRARPMRFKERCALCLHWVSEGELLEQRGINVCSRCYDERTPGDN